MLTTRWTSAQKFTDEKEADAKLLVENAIKHFKIQKADN
jgi:hypothetical protein